MARGPAAGCELLERDLEGKPELAPKYYLLPPLREGTCCGRLQQWTKAALALSGERLLLLSNECGASFVFLFRGLAGYGSQSPAS